MKKIYVLSALTVVLSGSLHASDYVRSGYIGVGLGSTKSDVLSSQLTNPDVCAVVGSSCSVDRKDRMRQLFGGYNFSRHFALEGAYTDLGKTADITDGTIRGTQETKALSLSLLGKVPLSTSVSLYGKAGVYRWKSDMEIASLAADSSGTDAVLGLGLEYRMARNWSARLSWDRYNNVGNRNAFLESSGADTLNVDVDVYSIGVQYNF